MTLLPRSLSLDQLKTTFLRFPFALLSSAGCAALMIWSTWSEVVTPEWASRLMSTLFIGILMFGGLALFAEGLKLRSWLIQLLGAPVLYFLVYNTHSSLFYGTADTQRLAMVFVASLALIFAGSRLARRTDKEELLFWEFGIATWFRALVAVGSAIIFVIGFQLALYSVEQLFDLVISYHWPETLMAFFGVFVASVIFYSGVPRLNQGMDRFLFEEKSARTLAVYLSFPLLSTYFLILTAYVVKILGTQMWPNGWVALPVLLFTLLGFGTYALIYPIKDEKKSVLVRGFAKVFPYTTLPFLAVYFTAFWIRVSNYGFTEMRCMGILLGVVITLWALHFGFYKKPTLRTIPVTLAFTAFLFSFGPWGVSSFSEWSQMNGLQKILIQNGILVDGAIVPATSDLPDEVDAEVSSKVDYLLYNYGEEVFTPWFGTGVTGMNPGDVVAKLGLTYWGNSYGSGDQLRVSYWTDSSEASQVSGYSTMVRYYGSSNKDDTFQAMPSTYSMPNGAGDLTVSTSENAMAFEFKDKTYTVALDEFIGQLQASGSTTENTPREVLSLTVNQGAFKAKIFFNSLELTSVEGAVVSMYVDTDIYLNIK